MEYSEILEKIMPTFTENKGEVIPSADERADKIVQEWASLINIQSRKGLIPLFITGSGVSINAGVPDMTQIIQRLSKLYEDNVNESPRLSEINKLFELWKEGRKDRSIVARLLSAFQERDELSEIWKAFNEELLRDILKANTPIFHEKLAELYETFNAMCLTLNFDGLLIREMVINRNKKAFSLPTKEECESFFVRLGKKKNEKDKNGEEFLEIQVRGDILYLECKNKSYCPQKGKRQPLWTSIPLLEGFDINKIDEIVRKIIKCPSCSDPRESYLSFPVSRGLRERKGNARNA